MDLPDVRQLFDLSGRVALVTGGVRGLGFEMARAFAAAGAHVVVSSRKPVDCEAAAADIRAQGGEASGFACHMGDPAQVRALAEHLRDSRGRLDILVNNAAAALPYGLDDATEELFDKSFAVNARGPLLLVKALRPLLAASPSATRMGASIINVLSMGAFRGGTASLGYGASKAALWHMTRSLAATLAPEGIRVNALAPGPMATRMLMTGDSDLLQRSAQGTLLKRIADPGEIMGPALYLASDASSFVTGSVVVVDGGWLA